MLEPNEEEDQNKRMRQLGVYLTIPFALAVPPLIGWLIGSRLDSWLNTKPYLMFFLIFLGFLAGIKELYRIIKVYGNTP